MNDDNNNNKINTLRTNNPKHLGTKNLQTENCLTSPEQREARLQVKQRRGELVTVKPRGGKSITRGIFGMMMVATRFIVVSMTTVVIVLESGQPPCKNNEMILETIYLTFSL